MIYFPLPAITSAHCSNENECRKCGNVEIAVFRKGFELQLVVGCRKCIHVFFKSKNLLIKMLSQICCFLPLKFDQAVKNFCKNELFL